MILILLGIDGSDVLRKYLRGSRFPLWLRFGTARQTYVPLVRESVSNSLAALVGEDQLRNDSGANQGFLESKSASTAVWNDDVMAVPRLSCRHRRSSV